MYRLLDATYNVRQIAARVLLAGAARNGEVRAPRRMRLAFRIAA